MTMNLWNDRERLARLQVILTTAAVLTVILSLTLALIGTGWFQ